MPFKNPISTIPILIAPVLVVTALAMLFTPATSAEAQNRAGRSGPQVCRDAALSDADKSACASAMKNAATRADRQQVRDNYTAKIQAANASANAAKDSAPKE